MNSIVIDPIDQTDELIRVNLTELETVLKTVHVADFSLFEDAGGGYRLEVVTRTLGGSKMGHYALEQVRGRGVRVWRTPESAFRFIKSVCHGRLVPRGVFVVFNTEKQTDIE